MTRSPRVKTAIAELSYRPSSLARSLVSKRTQTVGLLVSDVGNPYYADVIHGVEDRAVAEGYEIFLCNTNYSEGRGLAFIQSLSDKHVDGMLIMSSNMSDGWIVELSRGRVPAVIVNWQSTQALDGILGMITIDFASGIDAAAEHLIALGHRRFAHVSGPLHLATARWRRDAFLASLEARGIDPSGVAIIEGDLRTDGGRRAMAGVLKLRRQPTAIFAANDLTAIGLAWAAHDRGVRVPEDMSIVGLDGIPLGAEISPSLTTVAIPRYEVGSLAMSMLLELQTITGEEKVGVCRAEITTRLLLRQSTGPAAE